MADAATRQAWGDALYAALRARTVVDPLTVQDPSITIDDAYHVSRRILERRLDDGERLVGKKIGVTSRAVQDMLGVHQPDFGYLTDAMHGDGELPISRLLIQPRAEGEIAFVLGRDLVGPGVTPEQALAAIDTAHACFEIVDSRIRDWRIAIQDTVADNASSGLFVMGPGVRPHGLDLTAVRLVVHKNGRKLSEGVGAAALGSPLICVAWLANTLGAYGIPLRAGEIVLSGSLVPLEPVVAGDHMHVEVEGLGATEVVFT
ncbi:MAG: fumarylacetoacetate hydrolase family protein [Alphaproteobacteria bacterium]|nr:fumarylacetoacetate hydrolase family protein [Alphaproteobacteria bacterium]